MPSFSLTWVVLILATFVVAGGRATSSRQTGSISYKYFLQNPLAAVKFYFYSNSRDFGDYKDIQFGNENSLKEFFIPDGTMLKIVIHGFDNEAFSTTSQTVKDAYLEHSNNPVICLDWSAMSGYKAPFNYFLYPNIADFNVPKVSQHLAQFLVNLRNSQVLSSLDKVHIIGHSLGAQIAGQAGHIVRNLSGGEQVGRITGLDPARPNFKDKDFHLRLDKEDAIFVDIIHTTSIVGDMLAAGDVDFYPNIKNSASAGQPGCYGFLSEREYCSHLKVADFFAQSISQSNMFGYKVAPSLARSGESTYPRRCSGICDKNVIFGEHISPYIRGEYCLII